MDGNGRWAERQGLPRLVGHANGHKAARRVIQMAPDYNVQYLSLYTFSTENWRRSKEEVDGLMRLIEETAIEELPVMKRNGVRILVSGRMGDLPESLQSTLTRAQQETADNAKITVNLAINYGGRAEIIDAIKKLAQQNIDPNDLTEERFAQALYQPSLPDPDLLIRTAGEMRFSNFLIWQTAYTEVHITETLWPDFDATDLQAALEDYRSRSRKFGGIIVE